MSTFLVSHQVLTPLTYVLLFVAISAAISSFTQRRLWHQASCWTALLISMALSVAAAVLIAAFGLLYWGVSVVIHFAAVTWFLFLVVVTTRTSRAGYIGPKFDRRKLQLALIVVLWGIVVGSGLVTAGNRRTHGKAVVKPVAHLFPAEWQSLGRRVALREGRSILAIPGSIGIFPQCSSSLEMRRSL